VFVARIGGVEYYRLDLTPPWLPPLLTYPYRVSEHPEPRPRDDTDVVKDIARDLADIAHQIATFNAEANGEG
jgi:hypothetical protein